MTYNLRDPKPLTVSEKFEQAKEDYYLSTEYYENTDNWDDYEKLVDLMNEVAEMPDSLLKIKMYGELESKLEDWKDDLEDSVDYIIMRAFSIEQEGQKAIDYFKIENALEKIDLSTRSSKSLREYALSLVSESYDKYLKQAESVENHPEYPQSLPHPAENYLDKFLYYDIVKKGFEGIL